MAEKKNKLRDLIPRNLKIPLIEVDPKIADTIVAQKIGKKIEGDDDRTYILIDNSNHLTIYTSDSDKESAKKLIESYLDKCVHLVKESNVAEDSIILANIRKSTQFINKIEQYLSPMDYGALVFANSVIQFENQGVEPRKLQKQILSSYKTRGLRIYCSLKSGTLEKELQPLLKGKEEDKIRKTFDELIQPQPCLCIDKCMDAEEIIKEIDNKWLKGYYDIPVSIPTEDYETTIETINTMMNKDENIEFCTDEDQPANENDFVTFHILNFDKIPLF